MNLRDKNISPERPPVDEWGMYDPDQAGLTAVLERMDARRRAGALPAPDAASMLVSMRDANEIAKNDKT
jgi:hypothetical protein